ncbi:MAG TPA: anaerobic C4-dicarboxylate transporter family protein, partial [Pyrinomonadaceae bacterium]|nr:anaerobic C4-dicarboxylate transporter family protein [Pyrinomonadaceae bacterium]
VITALAAMQAAGGLEYLVSLAERVMRSRPQYITFIAPIACYILTFGAGTQNVVYALLPVIAEVSLKAGVRPERPLSISVVGSYFAAVASPVSAVSVAMIGFLAVAGLSLPSLLMVMVPSTFIAVLLGATAVAWRGKELSDDPEYQRRLEAGEIKLTETAAEHAKHTPSRAKGSATLFLVGVLLVVIIGVFPDIRPAYEVVKSDGIYSDQVSMGNAIMIVMIAVAGLIMIVFKSSPEETLKSSMMRSGITAIISILGVSWLGSSFFEGNREAIVGGISDLVRVYPIAFAGGMFLLSILLFSQAATVALLIPVGIALGIPMPMLVAFYPASAGLFFLPTYGTSLAAVSFDQTGTTRIGKYLLNHSFMLPGLVTMVSSIAIAMLLSKLFLS